jgi:hypothetical protein
MWMATACLLTSNLHASELVFPQRFGEFANVRFIDFEAEGVGTGFAHTYRRDAAAASIFIYPDQFAAETVRHDLDSVAMQTEFERAKRGFEDQIARAGRTNLEIVQSGRTDKIGESRECLSLLASYQHGNRSKIVWQCLTPFRNGVLMLRYTVEPDPGNRRQQTQALTQFQARLADWIASSDTIVPPRLAIPQIAETTAP